MNNRLTTLRLFTANLLWLLSCLPRLAAFLLACGNVRRTQSRLLARILKDNASTAIGTDRQFHSCHNPDDFTAIPLSEYEDYTPYLTRIREGHASVLTRAPVLALQPTSGSTADTKWIPYTHALRNAFGAAIDPWIATLYLRHPSLLLGRHYWSISPNTRPPPTAPSTIRTGFVDDAEYLTRGQRLLARTLFAVPSELAQVTDPDAFEHLTLIFLLRDRNLRLISVWHPSFLCALLNALPRHLQPIITAIETGVLDTHLPLPPELRANLSRHLIAAPARAAELRRIAANSVPAIAAQFWPNLTLISCWTTAGAAHWLDEIRRQFPRTTLQAKGLTATEGIISFPIGHNVRHVCAIRSHFLEFEEPTTGIVRRAWDLTPGREYSIILTTQGGLYRYRLHDLVRVTGYFRRAPCIEFIGRDNLVSDLVGEKLNGTHVAECIAETEKACGIRFTFAMLAPCISGQSAGYTLYAQAQPAAAPSWDAIRTSLESGLSRNYHYRHAREHKQLSPLRIFRIEGDATTTYRRHLIQKGTRAGDIKFDALSRHTGWTAVFRGDFTPTPP